MIVIDVETTGTNPYKHGIISIGAVNFKHPDQYFYAEGRPNKCVGITQGALDVNGYTLASLAELPLSMLEVMNSFYDWLALQSKNTPMIMAGHNVSFDYYFIKCEHERCGIESKANPFRHRIIDLHSVAQTHYIMKKGFQYNKAMAADFIQKQLGLPVEPSPHYALNGAVYEAECFSRLWFNKCLFDDFAECPILDNPWE